MKFIRSSILILAALQFAMTIAHANEINLAELPDVDVIEIQTTSPEKLIEPVSSNQLRLMGSGFEDSETEQSIALACYDDECRKLRFVYFKSPSEAYFVGSLLQMPQSDNERLKKKALKIVIQEFFDRHRTNGTHVKLERHGLTSFLLIGGAAGLAVVTGGTSALIMGGVIAGAGGSYFLLSSRSLLDYVTSGVLIEASMTEGRGWNWSSTGKKISHDQFATILDQIVNGEDRWDSQGVLNESRTWLKKKRLIKRGVEF